MRITRALACALLVAGCGDNDHLGGGQLVVSPQTDLHTSDRGGTATFTVSMTDPPVMPVVVDLTSSDPSLGVVDPPQLRFTRAGYSDLQTITITGVENHVASGPQDYLVHVAPEADDIDPVDVTVTNDDSDMGGIVVSPTLGLTTTQAGGQATFTVVLGSQPMADVMIPLQSSDMTEGVIDQPSLTFTADNWNMPQTVTITGVDNGLDLGDVAYTIVSDAATSADAVYGGMDPDDVQVTNLGHVLTGLEITPVDSSIANGTQEQLTATALYSDGAKKDVTPLAMWTSSMTNVATLSMFGMATAKHVGMTTVSATYKTAIATTSLTVTGAMLTSIEVTPTDPSIANGTKLPFTATGLYSDGSTQDLTGAVTWASSATNVATISAGGQATAAHVGQTTISASQGAISGSTTLTVTNAVLVSIDVTPSDPTIARFTTQQFTATGLYSDSSTQDLTTQVTWSSSLTTVATITPGGLAAGVGPGMTTIRAALGAISGTTTLTVTDVALVSIEVLPANPSIAKGTKQQFTAIGHFSNGGMQDLTQLATWGSSNSGVATISNAAPTRGLASSANTGTTTISATFASITGTTTLTVTAAVLASIRVTPANPTIAKGTTLPFTATGVYSDNSTQDLTTQATWASSAPTVASISNAPGSQGLASALNVGITTIRATFGGIVGSTQLRVTAAALVSIAVTPANPSVPNGLTQQFTAVGTYTDGTMQTITTQVTWGSSNPGVATISNAAGSQGLASTHALGQTTISATLGGVTGSTVLTVIAPVVTALVVTPANPTIDAATTIQFTASLVFSDGSTQNVTATAAWSSSDLTVATILPTGLAAGLTAGMTTIRATASGFTGSTVLTVNAPKTLVSLDVTPVDPTLSRGSTLQLAATANYSDGSTSDVTSQATWSSSNTTTATVVAGLLSANEIGSSTITAAFGGKSGTSTVTVIGAALQSITVTPANPSLPRGLRLQFTATAHFADGTTSDVSGAATWTSSSTFVANISNGQFRGRATANNVGTTTITAAFGGMTGSTTLTVTAATLVSIAIMPLNASIARNTQLQYTAIGTFSDGTMHSITDVATWTSGNFFIANISSFGANRGLATGRNAGTTTITARYAGHQASTLLTVRNATLVSIAVTPANPTLQIAQQRQMTATGTFSDGSMQDLTRQVAWASSNTTIVSVSNAIPSKGRITGTGAGTAQIAASTLGVFGTTDVTVQ